MSVLRVVVFPWLKSMQHFRTTEALEMTRALQGGLYEVAQASLKVAESSLGLGDMYWSVYISALCLDDNSQKNDFSHVSLYGKLEPISVQRYSMKNRQIKWLYFLLRSWVYRFIWLHKEVLPAKLFSALQTFHTLKQPPDNHSYF